MENFDDDSSSQPSTHDMFSAHDRQEASENKEGSEISISSENEKSCSNTEGGESFAYQEQATPACPEDQTKSEVDLVSASWHLQEYNPVAPRQVAIHPFSFHAATAVDEASKAELEKWILSNLMKKEKGKVLRDEVRQRCAGSLGKSFNIRRFGEAMRSVFPDAKCNNAGRSSADAPLVYYYYGVTYRDEEEAISNFAAYFPSPDRSTGGDDDSLIETRASGGRMPEISSSVAMASAVGFAGLLPSPSPQTLPVNVAAAVTEENRRLQNKRRILDSADDAAEVTLVSSVSPSANTGLHGHQRMAALHCVRDIKQEKQVDCFYCGIKDQEIAALRTLVDRLNVDMQKKDSICEVLRRENLTKEREVADLKEKLGELQKKVEIVQRVLSI